MVAKWTTPVPGREKAAFAYGREVDNFFGKKAAEGLHGAQVVLGPMPFRRA